MNKDKEELIKESGSESEATGIKAVQELSKLEEQQGEREENKELNQLEDKRRSLAYDKYIGGLLYKELLKIDWPEYVKWKVRYSEKGVVVFVKIKGRRVFYRAFRPVRNPVFDLNAVHIIGVQVENTIDKITGALVENQSPSGLWLPQRS